MISWGCARRVVYAPITEVRRARDPDEGLPDAVEQHAKPAVVAVMMNDEERW
jgi:hypothetical protein